MVYAPYGGGSAPQGRQSMVLKETMIQCQSVLKQPKYVTIIRKTNVSLTLSQTEKYKARVFKHIHKPILQKYESNNSLVPFLKN